MTHQRSIRRIALATTVLASELLFVAATPALAQDLPDTGNLTTVTRGLSGGAPGSTNPAISTSGAAGVQTMRVDLRDNRTIMTWGGAGFNVAAGNAVDFKDARATSGVTGRTDNIAVLNRDIGGGFSNIQGALRSDPNVAVYLINRGGIIFGQNSTVNTGALFASATDITNDNDFLNASTTLNFGASGDNGFVIAQPGAQIQTAATTGSDGGRIGDIFFGGSHIYVGQDTTLTATGDVAMLAAREFSIQSAPGSPLSFTITRLSDYSGNQGYPINLYGNISARNMTFAAPGLVGEISGTIVATGAMQTDRGVILTPNATIPGVSYAPGLTTASDFKISANIDSARNISAYLGNTYSADLTGALTAHDLIDITTSGFGGLQTTATAAVTGGSITIHNGVYFTAKVTTTSGDLTIDGGVQAIFQKGISVAGNLTGTTRTFLTQDQSTIGGSVSISTSGTQNWFGGTTVGGSATLLGIGTGGYPDYFDYNIGLYGGFSAGGDITAKTLGMIDIDRASAGGKLSLESDYQILLREGVGSHGINLIAKRGPRDRAGLVGFGTLSATGSDADLHIDAFEIASSTIPLDGIPVALKPLQAGRDVILSIGSPNVINPGTVTAGRNVQINANVRADNIEATTGFVSISGNASITSIIAGADIMATGQVVSIDNAKATNGKLAIAATSPTLTNGTAGGDVRITATGGNAIVRGNIAAGGDLIISGNSVLLGTDAVTTLQKAKGAVSLTALNDHVLGLRGLTLQSNSDGAGSEALTLSAAKGVMFDAETALLGGTARQSDIQIRTSGSQPINLGAVTGRGLLGAIGNATFTTGLSTSAGITVLGAISLTDALKLNSRSVRTAQVTASDIEILGGQRAEGTALTATGTIYVRATDSVQFTDLFAPGGITLAATGGLPQSSGYIAFSSAKALGNDADITISAGRSVTGVGFNVPVQAGRDVRIRANTLGVLSQGELGVNLGSIKAGRDLTIISPGIAGDALQAVAGSVSLTGTGGSLKAFSITAAGSIAANGTSVSVRQAFAPNGAMALTADAGDLTLGETGYASFAGGGDMALAANGGSIRIGGSLTSVRDLTIAGDRVDIIGYLDTPLSIRAKGTATIDAGTGGITASANGGMIQSNSDGIGEEALTLQTSGGISMLVDLLGGTARQSDIRLRYGADKPLQFFGISARSLLGASGSAPFANGINTTSGIGISGQIDLVNSLTLTGSQVGVKAINIRNGNVDIRTTGENLELSAPIVASGDIFLDADARGLLIDGGGSVSGRNVVLSMGDAFVNLRGSDAIAASGHWVVYSQSPSFEPVYESAVEFGGLDSGATALWGATYATRAPSTISGNRYVFAVKPTLTFTAADLTKIYGTDLSGSASLPFNVTGYQPGVAGAFMADTAATAYTGNPLITSPGFATRATVAGGPYTTSIAQGSLASDAGYTFAFDSPGMVTVTPKALTGTIAIDTKTYDGTTAATGSVDLADVVSGDSVGTAGSVFSFADKNAGTGKTVTVSGTTLNGADAGNYTLTLPASALADILKKALTGTIAVDAKTYDSTITATGRVDLSGVVSGDTVGTTGSVFTFADRNAGAGKSVSINGTALNGADAGNYTLTIPASALGDILKKALTGTVTVSSKTYDGTTAATGSVGLSGVLSGDSVGTTGSVFTFADRNAGTAKAVAVTGTALNGADGGNYTLMLPASAVADILKRAIAVTADDRSKHEGESDPMLTFTIAGGSLVNGDTLAGALARAPGEDKGDYAITQGTLSGGQNYQLTFHDGVFTITERRIPETVAQPLRSVVLPNQLSDLSPTADEVTIDGAAVCAQDPNCVSTD